MEQNALAGVYRAARAAAAVAAQSPGESVASGAASSATTVAGTFDTVTGDLKPAGITGITLTSEPFYSAKG